ncbi:MAG TPA: ABC transporter ATP-binding protein [Thermodesulfobacteriota bacterium]
MEARGLAKRFGGVEAVRGVDLAVRRGEVAALIGPNGAGKTTCFNLLTGQLRPDAGRVWLRGRDVTGRPPHDLARLGVGRTFQVTAAFASMTVRENVQVACLARHRRLTGLVRPAAGRFAAEADALLERVGMADQAGRACGVLAYGDLKRVELAVALAHEPDLLLMDEPTAGLAPPERHALMALVSALVADRGLTVLFTEHDMDVVFGHAARVLVMHRGEIIADGPPDVVRADPRVQAVYLGGGT